MIVYFDGSDHWLSDGFHRFHSAKRNKAKSIRAEVRTGRRAITAEFGTAGKTDAHQTRNTLTRPENRTGATAIAV